MASHSENDYKEETNVAVYFIKIVYITADMSIKTKLESSKGALAHDSTFFSFFNSHALMRPTMMALHSAFFILMLY